MHPPCAYTADVFAQAGKVLSLKDCLGDRIAGLQLFSCGLVKKVDVEPMWVVNVTFLSAFVVVVGSGVGRVVSTVVGVRSRLMLNAVLPKGKCRVHVSVCEGAFVDGLLDAVVHMCTVLANMRLVIKSLPKVMDCRLLQQVSSEHVTYAQHSVHPCLLGDPLWLFCVVMLRACVNHM